MFGHSFRTPLTGALAAGLVLALAACGGDGTGAPSRTSTAAIDCTPYTKFGDLKGRTVTIFTGIMAPEDAAHRASYQPFEDCTGIKVDYQNDKSFESKVLTETKAGHPPDLAVVPQPGLLKQLVATGRAVPAPADVAANVNLFWSADWKAYGTVGNVLYAAPLGASVKSLVWYSPQEFQQHGYQVPTTLDELKRLSDRMVADGRKPWCAGISSGDATGWPITDWMEDFMLRLYGPDKYDEWVDHEIPFNGPEATTALDAVGAYLKNPKYVNGGLGDVKSIATTTFQDAGLPILGHQCEMHRQASFYAASWPKGTAIAQDGAVYAFYLPGKDTSSKPVLGGGEFVLAFSRRPEVQAFQTYLSSDVWANTKARLSSGWVSANRGLELANLSSPIDKLAATLLADPRTVFRFDGSDQMPAVVGAGSFWKQSTKWIDGQDTKTTLDNIEKSWPAASAAGR
jgi:alpha-glucoside transport system substrate-binding protein